MRSTPELPPPPAGPAVRLARLTAGAAPVGANGDLRSGRSVDIARPNRYRPAEQPADAEDEDEDVEQEEPGRGVLTHIAVEAAGAAQSRVGVLVDGGAHYTLKRSHADELVLTLYDTRAANLDVRRILDARGLDGRIRRVLPSVEEEGRHRVVLTIELKQPSRVHLSQADGMLWLGFGDEASRPTSM